METVPSRVREHQEPHRLDILELMSWGTWAMEPTF